MGKPGGGKPISGVYEETVATQALGGAKGIRKCPSKPTGTDQNSKKGSKPAKCPGMQEA